MLYMDFKFFLDHTIFVNNVSGQVDYNKTYFSGYREPSAKIREESKQQKQTLVVTIHSENIIIQHQSNQTCQSQCGEPRQQLLRIRWTYSKHIQNIFKTYSKHIQNIFKTWSTKTNHNSTDWDDSFMTLLLCTSLATVHSTYRVLYCTLHEKSWRNHNQGASEHICVWFPGSETMFVISLSQHTVSDWGKCWNTLSRPMI